MRSMWYCLEACYLPVTIRNFSETIVECHSSNRIACNIATRISKNTFKLQETCFIHYVLYMSTADWLLVMVQLKSSMNFCIVIANSSWLHVWPTDSHSQQQSFMPRHELLPHLIRSSNIMRERYAHAGNVPWKFRLNMGLINVIQTHNIIAGVSLSISYTVQQLSLLIIGDSERYNITSDFYQLNHFFTNCFLFYSQ